LTTCSVCGTVASTERGLTRHMRLRHGKLPIEKTCLKCGLSKQISEYRVIRTGFDGLPCYAGHCRSCSTGGARQPGTHRRASIKRHFGLSLEEYEAAVLSFLEFQDGRCAICRSDDPSPYRGSTWALDHDHATGVLRGVLCQPCNIGLGHFKDSPEALTRAATYLRTRS
jgi:hypothetical protein